jgi:hypothetical protein
MRAHSTKLKLEFELDLKLLMLYMLQMNVSYFYFVIYPIFEYVCASCIMHMLHVHVISASQYIA